MLVSGILFILVRILQYGTKTCLCLVNVNSAAVSSGSVSCVKENRYVYARMLLEQYRLVSTAGTIFFLKIAETFSLCTVNVPFHYLLTNKM